MPCTTRLSLVKVPVLSKQQTSTLPANGIRNGSVQNTSAQKNKNNKGYHFIFATLNNSQEKCYHGLKSNYILQHVAS
jgi:hypothetical protein